MSQQVFAPGHYGNLVYVQRYNVTTTRTSVSAIVPKPQSYQQYRSLVFRPKYVLKARGQVPVIGIPLMGFSYSQLQRVEYPLLELTLQPPFFATLPTAPTMASWVYSQLQRVKVVPLDLTVQPPPFSTLPPPPTVPTMGFFFTMNPAILAQLLIRGFITPSQLLGPPRSPLFGREQLAEHRQYTNFENQAARFA